MIRSFLLTAVMQRFAMRLLWGSCLLVLTQLTSVTDAATFCIETQIFEGSNLDPSAEHRILFDNGLVYDLPQIESRYVTCYDPAQKMVTLMDRQRQVQTRIDTDELVRITARARAAATPEQQAKFGLHATVKPSKRVIGYSIQFGDIEYNTTTQSPADPSIATDYGNFAILASQLNVMRRLGPPPFGRMTLNSHIAQNQELPLETTLTIQRGEESQEYRSTHKLVTTLSPDDEATIKEVRGMMTLYRNVEPREF